MDRDEVLAALAASPFDDDLRRVAADQLQRLGDPLGELAIVQDRLARAPDDAGLARREAELREALGDTPHLERLGDDSHRPFFGARWRLGFIAHARLLLSTSAGLARVEWTDVVDAVRWLARSPTAWLLEELELHVGLAWWRDVIVEELLVELLAREAWPALRRLSLGGFVEPAGADGYRHVERDISAVYITNASWPGGEGRLCTLLARCPAIEEVRVHGNVAHLGTIDAPRLRVFEVCTSSLGRTAAASLRAARWPALERLELWFGDGEYGAGEPCDGADLAALAHALEAGCPKLGHLALANTPCTDDLLVELVREPPRALLGRLEVFDVSLGTLGDAGAHALIALRPLLPRLATLNIAHHYVTPAVFARLWDAYAGVTVLGLLPQRDDEGRYCAVSE